MSYVSISPSVLGAIGKLVLNFSVQFTPVIILSVTRSAYNNLKCKRPIFRPVLFVNYRCPASIRTVDVINELICWIPDLQPPVERPMK